MMYLPTRPACQEVPHATMAMRLMDLEIGLADVDLFEEDLSRVQRETAQNRLLCGARLLVDFLEHEVPVARLLGHHRIPHHSLGGLRNLRAGKVGEFHAVPSDDGHFLVAKEHDIARVTQNGWNVGSHEELVLTEPDDDGGAVANRNDLSWIVGRDDHQRKKAAKQQERAPDRHFQARIFHFAFDEMSDDLGIRFRDEPMALPLKLALQIEVVLDDAVVHDHDLPAAVAVRVRILFCRTTVRGPSCMADTVVAGNRLGIDRVRKTRQLAGRPAQLDAAVVYHGNARRIVTAVLEAPEPLDEHGNDRLGPDVTNDAAHSLILVGLRP